jgi:hypothetical protein
MFPALALEKYVPLYGINEAAKLSGSCSSPVVGARNMVWGTMSFGVILEFILTQEGSPTIKLSVLLLSSNEDHGRTNSALCKRTGVNQSAGEGAQ